MSLSHARHILAWGETCVCLEDIIERAPRPETVIMCNILDVAVCLLRLLADVLNTVPVDKGLEVTSRQQVDGL